MAAVKVSARVWSMLLFADRYSLAPQLGAEGRPPRRQRDLPLQQVALVADDAAAQGCRSAVVL